MIYIGSFCFGDQDTIESVIIFRIDGRTIKRGALIGQLDHLVPLGVGKLASHFRPRALLIFLSIANKKRVLNLVPSDSAKNACWYLLTCHLF